MTPDLAHQIKAADKRLQAALADLGKAGRRFDRNVTKERAALRRRRDRVAAAVHASKEDARRLKQDVALTLADGPLKPSRELTATQLALQNAREFLRNLQAELAHIDAELDAQAAAAVAPANMYRAAYNKAYSALARLRALWALRDHGQAIAQAVAMLRIVPLASDALTGAGGGLQVSRAEFVWQLLQRMADDAPAGPLEGDVEDVLGALPFAPNATVGAELIARERAAAQGR